MLLDIMKRFRWMAAAMAGAIALGAVLLAGCGGSSLAQDPPDPAPAPSPIEGTWRVQVTLYDCSTFATKPPFWSLLTFGRDGTVTEATNNPLLAGARSPGNGFWTSTGQNTYNAVAEAFIYSDVPNTPIKAGTQKILQNITMTDNNNWSENGAEVKFFDTSGSNYLTGCANATATRLTSSDSAP